MKIMEFTNTGIQVLVEEIKEHLTFSDTPWTRLVSPSAYDTAWLAMIPAADLDEKAIRRPMFEACLNWVLANQTEEGFWGNCDAHSMPTIEALPSTLACLIALKKWNVGAKEIEKGLAFVHMYTENLLGVTNDHFPRWFAIVFPGMVDLAHSVGLELAFPVGLKGQLLDNLYYQRQQILETEELVGDRYPPLLSYLEALPPNADNDNDVTQQHISDDGSLFQSPSATARAFMATGNKRCLAYLQSLLQRCATNGVPQTYPMDEELIQLCIVNQIQRLGLADHFSHQIEDILAHIFRNYSSHESAAKSSSQWQAALIQLYKDSLAFRLLRMHGYNVSPRIFSMFLNDEVREHIENNYEFFSSIMLNVYRATDFMFPGEYELQEARSFSREQLEKVVSKGPTDQNQFKLYNLKTMIKHDLSLPWMARLDHLEHRIWIEEKDMNALWMGKTSFHRLSCVQNDKLKELAARDYEFRQSIYRNELEELKRWTKRSGLGDMGFGREKTTYLYFAMAACILLPYDSDVRLMVAKGAILVTVADDFFDMEGSLSELNSLTDAVQRWDNRALSGHGKTIFDALDNLVAEIAAKYFQQQGTDITEHLKNIWKETFVSWLVEAERSKSGCIPTMDEYLQTGMISIASHTIILPACCFLNPSLPTYKLKTPHYETVTKLLMLIPRLLNDIQSYQKEQEQGKLNFVLLYLKENPEADIVDSVSYVRDILERKREELLKHVLMDGYSDLPKQCKHLHLSCVKVFQMFFHSTNGFDSDTEMLQDIQKAIYLPLNMGKSRPLKHLIAPESGTKNKYQTLTSYFDQPARHHAILHRTS